MRRYRPQAAWLPTRRRRAPCAAISTRSSSRHCASNPSSAMKPPPRLQTISSAGSINGRCAHSAPATGIGLRRFLLRHRLGAFTGTITFCALLAGGSIALWQWRSASEEVGAGRYRQGFRVVDHRAGRPRRQQRHACRRPDSADHSRKPVGARAWYAARARIGTAHGDRKRVPQPRRVRARTRHFPQRHCRSTKGAAGRTT